MTPRFSIVTATYNAANSLRATADSLQAQAYRDFEWIVVDGNSSDGTSQMLNKLPGVTQWISEKDEGIADAWNKGIARATGQQVLILNAGDLYDPRMLAEISQVACSDYITCSHARLVDEEARERGIFQARPNLLWRGMHLPHNWASVPRHFYQQFGLYRKIPYAMDFEWFYRYYKQYGVSGFQVINKVLGSYLLGGHSDKNFVSGFKANREIMVAHGKSQYLASGIMWAYATNHFIRRRLAK